MIDRANELNRAPKSCAFLHNTGPDLSSLEEGSASFVYTSIVLQHMEQRYSIGYLREFGRLLAPGGILVAQIPDTTLSAGRRLLAGLRAGIALRSRLRSLTRRARGDGSAASQGPVAEMHVVSERVVARALADAGMKLIDVQLTNSTELAFNGELQYLPAASGTDYVGKQYCATIER